MCRLYRSRKQGAFDYPHQSTTLPNEAWKVFAKPETPERSRHDAYEKVCQKSVEVSECVHIFRSTRAHSRNAVRLPNMIYKFKTPSNPNQNPILF